MKSTNKYSLNNKFTLGDYTFPHIIQKYTKFVNFTGLYFLHVTMFCSQASQFYQILVALFICANECS